MIINCEIYRSGKKPDMYLYVRQGVSLGSLPAALLQQFGKAELAMSLELSPERKLARANVEQVMRSLEDQGYYLQMPPQPDRYMLDINEHNDKLAKR
jgi:uncharacterized protein YcgL (UPF0745 family)